MNIDTGASHNRTGVTAQTSRRAGAQLNLALEVDSSEEDSLRAAWTRCRLSIPYHLALQNRPLAICLSCLADAMRKKSGLNGCGTGGARAARRGRK